MRKELRHDGWDFDVTCLQVVAATLLALRCGGSPTQIACHDRYGYLNPDDFGRRACTLCYKYLFPSRQPPYRALRPDYIYLAPATSVRLTVDNWTEYDPVTAGSFEYGSSTDALMPHNGQAQVKILPIPAPRRSCFHLVCLCVCLLETLGLREKLRNRFSENSTEMWHMGYGRARRMWVVIRINPDHVVLG